MSVGIMSTACGLCGLWAVGGLTPDASGLGKAALWLQRLKFQMREVCYINNDCIIIVVVSKMQRNSGFEKLSK